MYYIKCARAARPRGAEQKAVSSLDMPWHNPRHKPQQHAARAALLAPCCRPSASTSKSPPPSPNSSSSTGEPSLVEPVPFPCDPRTRLGPRLQQRMELGHHLVRTAVLAVLRLGRWVLAALAEIVQVKHQAGHLAHHAGAATLGGAGAGAAKAARCGATCIRPVVCQRHHLHSTHHPRSCLGPIGRSVPANRLQRTVLARFLSRLHRSGVRTTGRPVAPLLRCPGPRLQPRLLCSILARPTCCTACMPRRMVAITLPLPSCAQARGRWGTRHSCRHPQVLLVPAASSWQKLPLRTTRRPHPAHPK